METRHFTADRQGERIDSFLARTVPEYSRVFWQKRCDEGRIMVNGKAAKPGVKLNPGDSIDAALRQAITPGSLQLPILYQDDDILVINKPAGILTHAKGVEASEFTVADFVRPYTTDGVDTNRPGIVHRLDRGTSGVIVAAKNPEARLWLQAQFSKRNVKKTYVAITHGHLKEPQAELDLPIERNPKKPQTFRVSGNGKPAQTVYRVDRSFDDLDMLTLLPHTGRTHQLRVHMAYLGHPIVGDPMYGAHGDHAKRMMLHAYKLELTTPSRQRMTFVAPIPPEFEAFTGGKG